MNHIWPPSFPELVFTANHLMAKDVYDQAADVYLLAASVAISAVHEDALLRQAWIASERIAGRRSCLEAGW